MDSDTKEETETDMDSSPKHIHNECVRLLQEIDQEPPKIELILKFALEKYPVGSEGFTPLWEALLFGFPKKEEARAALKKLNLPPSTCGKAIPEIEFLWMCETCMLKKVESCIPCYCSACFVPELHKGHEYSFQIGSGNATCDCGDDSWLAPSSYCPRHNKKGESAKLEEFLPIYNKTTTPIVIKELQRMCQGEMVACKSGDYVGNATKFRNVCEIFGLLRGLLAECGAFLKFVNESFYYTFPEMKTTHHCELAAPSKAKEEIAPHSCACTVLENAAKFLVQLAKPKEIADFFAELTRMSEPFADSLFGAFMKNYCYVFADTQLEEERSQILYKVLWQCSIEKKIPNKHIPKTYGNFVSCLQETIACVTSGNPEFIQKWGYFLMYDFYTFLNNEYYMEDFFITNKGFFSGFINAFASVEFYSSTGADDVRMGQLFCYLFEYLQRIFTFMLRPYNAKQGEVNKEIYRSFKESISKALEATPKVEDLNSQNIHLLRSFSYFLNKYIYMNFDSNAFGSAKFYHEAIKQKLLVDMEMEKGAFECFIREIIKRVLRVLCFTSELEIKLIDKQDPFSGPLLAFTSGNCRYAFISADIALVQNLLPLLPESSIDIFKEFELLPEHYSSALKMKLIGKELIEKSLRADKMYKLCCVLFNADCRLTCYINSLKEKDTEVDSIRLDMLCRKETVRLLLQEEDVHATYQHIDAKEMIKKYFPFMRHRKLIDFLENFLIKKPNSELALGEVSMKYFDFASFIRLQNETCSELNVKDIVKKLQLKDFSVLQAPVRLKEDMFTLQGIITAVNKVELAQSMSLYLGARKGDSKETDVTDIFFLKIAYEVNEENEVYKGIRGAFCDIAGLLNIDNELCMASKRKMLEAASSKPEVSIGSAPKADTASAARKEMVMKKLQEQRNQFAKKNEAMLEKACKDSSPAERKGMRHFDEICVICKEQLGEGEDYGRLCMMPQSKLVHKLAAGAYQKITERSKIRLEAPFPDQGTHSFISSCGHYIHLKCFYNSCPECCPACKSQVSFILPDISLGKPTDPAAVFPLIEELFDEELKDIKEPLTITSLSDYVWKSVALGANCYLQDFLSKQIEDTRCVFKIMMAWSDNKPSFTERANEIHLQKPHLQTVLQELVKKRVLSDGDMEYCIKASLIRAIQWIYLGYALNNVAEDVSMEGLEKAINGLRLMKNEAVNQDVISVLVESCVLQGVIKERSSEKLTNLVQITESSDIPGKISGLQKMLFPTDKENVVDLAVHQLLKTRTIKVKGVDVPLCAAAKEILRSGKDTPEKIAILNEIMGVTSYRISLIPLPEFYSDFELEFFSKNCAKCKIPMKNKIVCLLCGTIVCGASPCGCKNEGPEHAAKCNGESCIFLHTYFGSLLAYYNGLLQPLPESVYKSASLRDVNYFTSTARSMSAKELKEYKLNREAYNKWQTMIFLGKTTPVYAKALPYSLY